MNGEDVAVLTEMTKLKVGSLFTGIGGIDLGLERAGFEISWQCEIDPWCQQILEQHWPGLTRYSDIKEVTHAEKVDILAGGFPCQPVSSAGGKKAQADPRWLWPEYARLISIIRPRYVLVENVPGLLIRGMGDVVTDLATLGYDAEWDVLGAVSFGAPHRRERLFILAYDNSTSWAEQEGEREEVERSQLPTGDGEAEHVADTQCEGSQRLGAERELREAGEEEQACGCGAGCSEASTDTIGGGRDGRPWHLTEADRWPEPPDGGLTDVTNPERKRLEGFAGTEFSKAGRPRWVFTGSGPRPERFWEFEPQVGRVAHGVPRRVDRIKGLGNAVVPQLIEWIGKRLLEVHETRCGGNLGV